VVILGHWLAIEGVQPAIVQNPSPAELKSSEYQTSTSTSTGPSSALAAVSSAEGIETKQQVKHVLSKELQLYFERIVTALMNEEMEGVRETAVASLRSDPGLHQLVPYLVAFVAEKVTLSMLSANSDHT
jgi:transcription initiation factor TFIID subunit 6